VTVYLDLVVLLNFLVDFLLLLGTNRLSGYPPAVLRAAGAAALGGIYGGVCLLPGFAFLGSLTWRVVSLALMSLIAFGCSRSSLRRGVLFSLLSMALGGVAMGLEGGFWSLVLSAGCLALMCALGFRGQAGRKQFVQVQICREERQVKLVALQDTGNTLRDPVTGQPVLVVGADIACRLTPLTKHQLQNPLEAVGAIPGLRLIPYHTVGNPEGLLLALRIADVTVGKRKGSRLVAFAPENLSKDGAYQALTGGTV